MSEFRDLTAALRALSNGQRDIEDCMVVLVRNSEQEGEWRHEQRNRAAIEDGEKEERELAFKQLQDFMGGLHDNFAILIDRFDNFVATRYADVKGLHDRVQQLELRLGEEEVTKP